MAFYSVLQRQLLRFLRLDGGERDGTTSTSETTPHLVTRSILLG